MQVTLNWPSIPNALLYNVYRGTSSGGPYILIGQSNPNPARTTASTAIVTTYTDGPNNLVNGVDYYYVVSAVTQDGEAAYGPEYHAVWPGQPASVASLTGSVV